ncbi:MAG: hypothetical protein WCI04_03325 [archaeon]
MAVVDIAKLGIGFTIRKKLKKNLDIFPLEPNLGINGLPNLPAGVYKLYHFGGKPVQVCCSLYSPVNHKTPNQLIWQAVYRAGVVAYKALTSEQKNVYRVRAYGKTMSGYNIFMKEYLLSH